MFCIRMCHIIMNDNTYNIRFRYLNELINQKDIENSNFPSFIFCASQIFCGNLENSRTVLRCTLPNKQKYTVLDIHRFSIYLSKYSTVLYAKNINSITQPYLDIERQKLHCQQISIESPHITPQAQHLWVHARFILSYDLIS